MAETTTEVFDKKRLDRIHSPEQLSSYISAAQPSIWLGLCAVFVLLAGVLAWCVFGAITTTVDAVVVAGSTDGAVCLVDADGYVDLEIGQTVEVDGAELVVSDIPEEPVVVDGSFDDLTLETGGFVLGQYVYQVGLSGEVGPGVYEAEVVTSTISPIELIIE